MPSHMVHYKIVLGYLHSLPHGWATNLAVCALQNPFRAPKPDRQGWPTNLAICALKICSRAHTKPKKSSLNAYKAHPQGWPTNLAICTIQNRPWMHTQPTYKADCDLQTWLCGALQNRPRYPTNTSYMAPSTSKCRSAYKICMNRGFHAKFAQVH